MSETTRSLLLRLLTSDYSIFKRRLRRHLGSEDIASEVLHETYLRLNNMGDVGVVRYPAAYIYRVALNVAENRRVAELQPLSAMEVEALLQASDQGISPARIVEGRWDVHALDAALKELSPRTRAIFIAAGLEEVTHQVIADRYKISRRTVEKELKRALDHCAKSLDRKKI
jgi:RNA polymerase sigma factor (sigma-70 family)